MAHPIGHFQQCALNFVADVLDLQGLPSSSFREAVVFMMMARLREIMLTIFTRCISRQLRGAAF